MRSLPFVEVVRPRRGSLIVCAGKVTLWSIPPYCEERVWCVAMGRFLLPAQGTVMSRRANSAVNSSFYFNYIKLARSAVSPPPPPPRPALPLAHTHPSTSSCPNHATHTLKIHRKTPLSPRPYPSTSFYPNNSTHLQNIHRNTPVNRRKHPGGRTRYDEVVLARRRRDYHHRW